MSSSSRLSTRVLIAFACVYLLWGSTYVAIRLGVEVLPPLVLASVRFLIAGPLMLALCKLRGLTLRQSPRSLAFHAAIGILMLGLGNTAVVWAEQFIPSGLASLLVASIPLWVALLEFFLPGGEGLRARGWLGIAIGFAGLVVLLSPGLHGPGHNSDHILAGSIVAVLGAFAWSCASVLARRSRLTDKHSLPPPAFVSAAWQMLFAGLFNLAAMLATGGTWHVAWGAQAIYSVAYLVVFGSLVGYTAYIYLLDNVPVAKVSTYAYINPIVAVVLGASLLHERLVPIEYLGMAAILIAVYLVTSSRLKGVTSRPAKIAQTQPAVAPDATPVDPSNNLAQPGLNPYDVIT